MKHIGQTEKGSARVDGSAKGTAEGVTLTGPVDRRRMLVACGVGVAGLWWSALATGGKRADAASTGNHEEEVSRQAGLTEGFIVSGTKEAEAYLRMRGECLVREQAGTRYILRIRSEEECISDFLAETVLAIALPRVLSQEELWSVAQRNWRLVQIPVFQNADTFTRNRNRTAPEPDPEMFYLYLRGDMLAGRPKVRAFVQLCQFASPPPADAG